MIEVALTAEEAELVYRALVQHDGGSLCPDWPKQDQAGLTRALDRLRVDLLAEEKGGE